jgi:SAM-dependent methyltransferase
MSPEAPPIDVTDHLVAAGQRHPTFKRVVSPDGSRRQAALRALANRYRRARQAPAESEVGASPTLSELDPWFFDHYIGATDLIRDFLGGDGLSLAGKEVADIGCGDGFTDLGIAQRLGVHRLVGFDIAAVNEAHLLAKAQELVGLDVLPPSLEFVQCGERSLPAADSSFDWVVTWSAFEHVSDPLAVAREIRRVLRPDGMLFLQLYPFFHSAWGSHLEHWFDEPFVQHRLAPAEIRAHLEANPLPERPTWHEYMYEAFETLNGITVDDLQRALREAGFRICKAELYTNATHLPAESQDTPLSALLISGVKLLAQPI